MSKRILALIGAHTAAFFVAAWAAFGHTGPDLASAVFLGLISADAALLGLWGAIGKAPWPARLGVASIAIFFFWEVVLFTARYPSSHDAVFFAFIISLPCVVIGSVVGILRHGARQLTLRRASDLPRREGLQFSLRGLLMAMTLIAIVLSIGRLTRVMGEGGDTLRLLAVLLVIPPSFILIAVATFWATLGIGRPRPRLLVVIPFAFVVGFLSPLGVIQDLDWEVLLLWSCLVGTMAIVIAASLLVVRSAGWRLCSGNEEPESREAIGA